MNDDQRRWERQNERFERASDRMGVVVVITLVVCGLVKGALWCLSS